MLTTQQINDHLKTVTYKPGWAFKCYDGRWEGQHFVITTVVPDAYNLKETTTLDVHSSLPPMDDTDQLDRWIMWRLGIIELHEMREFYRVNDKPVSDPHAPFANRDLT